MRQRSIVVREAAPHEFEVAADFWVAMRRELDMPDEDLALDWKARSVRYFGRRHAAGDLRWFFAVDGDKPVASAAAFLLDGYPTEICLNRRVGYIAGVFVVPQYRRLGLARRVTEAALEWLWEIGCRAVRLHAAQNARAIYAQIGFSPSNEMIMDRPAVPQPRS